MRRPSIKTSLIGIIAMIACMFGGFSYLTLQGINQINASGEVIADNLLPSVLAASEMRTEFLMLRLAVYKHVIAKTDAETQVQEDDIKKYHQAVTADITDYQALVSSPAENDTLTAIKENFSDYLSQLQPVLALSRANKNEEAVAMLAAKLLPVANEMMKGTTALVDLNAADADVLDDSSEATYKSVFWMAGVAVSVIALALLGAITFMVMGVANPIVRITGAMKRLSEGDVASEIPFAGRADELGSMATAVEIFRQGAISNRQMEADAETNRKQADADRTADHARAEDAANERLRVATSSLAVGLKRLASGDLAFQLDEALAPEFEDLRHDFNSSVKQLGDTLSAIAETIMSIDNGTQEIAAGSNDLSKRTEQQAASLEETAAALDEITANVANSTKRTGEARTAATDANLSAAKSADVVSHAVDAMGRIESASQQISNIIGVIDEIAFQTNLLALNAGVEAARAGDAGRGFAVVAQEVRELAQRSAKAAKEIKGLILNSTTEVEGGVKLVRDTGVALKTIGEQIADINMHMESIATSAKEQATGLAEINTAVNSMDQGTQQNAAMVEQSTAASASLAIEAAKLRELVAQFKLHGAASKQVATLRQTSKAMGAPARNAAPVRQLPQARKVAAGASRGLAVVGKDSWEEF